MPSARVDSIDSIKDFRAYLTKFQDMASRALGDAESEVNRTQMQLEGEWPAFWSGQVRKRQEILVRAEEALRHKKLFKDATGSTPSAVDEMKAVAIAKKNLAEAQQKMANIKQAVRKLQKQAVLYKGQVAAFTNAVASGIPHGMAQLAGTIEQLEKYIGIAPATAEEGAEAVQSVGSLGGEGGPSMARAADEAAKEEVPGIDPTAIRVAAPTTEAIAAAQPLAAGAVKLACGTAGQEQQSAVAALANGAAPGDDSKIVVTAGGLESPRVYLLRSGSGEMGWRVGGLDEPAGASCRTMTAGDFRSGRPDLAGVLNLAANYLVVVDASGIVAVFNERDENVLPATAKAS